LLSFLAPPPPPIFFVFCACCLTVTTYRVMISKEHGGLDMKTNHRQLVTQLASLADININDNNPWNIQVKDDRFYSRVIKEGSLGLGESYMDGWWDCEQLDKLMFRALKSGLDERIKKNFKLILRLAATKIFNQQTKHRAKKVGREHYDLGNDLYQSMLDKNMNYTCGYWKNASNLDQAQEAKLDLICQKIGLTPGMKVLDIGCGWGAFAKHAATNYGAQVVGITISKEQVSLGQQLCSNLPVDIRFQDYREMNEKFDRIVSLGMFEHVGYKNYKTYMKVVRRCLKDDGLFLLHTIGSNVSGINTDSWINKYIFPNSMLPSAKQIISACEGLFVMEDWHNFGKDYDKTLMAWHKNFKNNWGTLKDKYGERFRRMWEYYLLSCAGVFRSRQTQLWQIILSKSGIAEGYTSIR
jgi:cyclopropane-fatty-acyl-phospholipid synthase